MLFEAKFTLRPGAHQLAQSHVEDRGIYGMAETLDDLLVLHSAADVCLGLIRVTVACLNIKRGLIRASVFAPPQSADSPGYGGIEIRFRPCNYPGGK